MLDELYHALDPVAFWVGPFAVRWYGLGYVLGILIGGWLFMKLIRRWGLRFTLDNLLTLFIAAALGIILGARLGYVLFYGGSFYLENPDKILAFSDGGMSFHGGVLGMLVAALVTSRLFHMPLLSLGDLIVCVAPVGIFLVRIANFINGELWGAPTNLPWGVAFESGGGVLRHPTQLYEAFTEGALLFAILFTLAWRARAPRRKALPRGSYLGLFLMLYGVFRIAIEFVRQPDVQLGYLAGGWLTMGMLLSLPLLLIGIALLVYAGKTRLPQKGLPPLPATGTGLSQEACPESECAVSGRVEEECLPVERPESERAVNERPESERSQEEQQAEERREGKQSPEGEIAEAEQAFSKAQDPF